MAYFAWLLKKITQAKTLSQSWLVTLTGWEKMCFYPPALDVRKICTAQVYLTNNLTSHNPPWGIYQEKYASWINWSMVKHICTHYYEEGTQPSNHVAYWNDCATKRCEAGEKIVTEEPLFVWHDPGCCLGYQHKLKNMHYPPAPFNMFGRCHTQTKLIALIKQNKIK